MHTTPVSLLERLRKPSADEAWVSLKSSPADLILMSLLLPDTDGLILCSTLKDRTHAPIVMLSERCDQVERALALESGAVDWLMTRSAKADELLSRVESIIQKHVTADIARG